MSVLVFFCGSVGSGVQPVQWLSEAGGLASRAGQQAGMALQAAEQAQVACSRTWYKQWRVEGTSGAATGWSPAT